MASVDLKDAYYSVRESPEHQKYLKCLWNGIVYKLSWFPNGSVFCLRKRIQLMKPQFFLIKMQSPDIDDSFLKCIWETITRNLLLMLLIQ